MDREQILRYLGSMTDDEFIRIAAEARGTTDSDIRSIVVKELQRPSPSDNPVRTAESAGDWKTAMALKSVQLNNMLNPRKG